MKKNLMIAMFLVSILMVSFVSAGITGYAISLRGGQTAFAGDLKVSNVQVDGGVGSVNVEGVSVSGREGETVTTPKGASVTFQRVKGATFFTKPKIEVVVTPKSISVVTETEEECSENCQTFTEVYKVKEGETINMGGDNVAINFITATQVILMVDGTPTNLLSEDQKFELSNGRVVVVKKVSKLEVAGSIGDVELGVLSSYKLKELQTITIGGDVISIDFISATQVVLDVNGQTTALLDEGNTFQLTNGQTIFVNKISKLEVAGSIGDVELDESSCYFIF